MQHRARGPRPRYFEDPQLDRFHVIVMALAGEVAVMHERLDTVERLAARAGVLSAGDIEAFEPDEAVLEERRLWREDYIARVLRVVYEEAAQLKDLGERFATVDDVIDSVSR
jgi:hypothetical protein